MKKTVKVQAHVPYEELHLKLLRARVDTHRKEAEKEALLARLEQSNETIKELLEAEQLRVEQNRAAWRIAGRLLLGLIACFYCAACTMACVDHVRWWTVLAPVLLMISWLRRIAECE